MLVCLGEEAAGAAAGVVDRLAELGGHGLDHGADDLARGEELAAVVILLPHAQEQALVGLGQQEDVSGVGGLVADAVDGVEDVEKVLLGVNADGLDGLHDLADDALARGGVLPLSEVVKGGKQVIVDEGESAAQGTVLELLALGPGGGSPVLPAVWRIQRGPEGLADGCALLGFHVFALIHKPQEEEPGELGDVLEGGGAVGAAHDVADGVYLGVYEGLGGSGH